MKIQRYLSLLLCAALGACGGGGGGGADSAASSQAAPATPAAPAPRSTALADTAVPAGFGFATLRSVSGLRSERFVPLPGPFAQPERAYVSLWYLGPDQERRQLALLRLSTLRALDARGGLSLQLPLNVSSLYFEAYDRGGAATAIAGEIKP
ncbi:MAG: hypothetical protein ACOVLH_08680 [Roseateles sp.]